MFFKCLNGRFLGRWFSGRTPPWHGGGHGFDSHPVHYQPRELTFPSQSESADSRGVSVFDATQRGLQTHSCHARLLSCFGLLTPSLKTHFGCNLLVSEANDKKVASTPIRSTSVWETHGSSWTRFRSTQIPCITQCIHC